MAIVIKEAKLFEQRNTAYGIAVNAFGECDREEPNGLHEDMALLKNQNQHWYTQYQTVAKSGLLTKNKYHVFSTPMVTLVSFCLKHTEQDTPEDILNHLIEPLLAFDQGYQTDGPMGHGIDTIHLPPMGVEYGLDWETVEDVLKIRLANMTVDFVFCVPSLYRPNRFSDKIVTDRYADAAYFFKGECPIGLTGKLPIEYEDPSGQLRTFENPNHFIATYLLSSLKSDVNTYVKLNVGELMEETKEQVVSFIRSNEKTLQAYIPNQSGRTPYRLDEYLSLLLNLAMEYRKHFDNDYWVFLNHLAAQGITYIYHCGYFFPKVLGLNLDIDLIDESKYQSGEYELRGKNLLGLLLNQDLRNLPMVEDDSSYQKETDKYNGYTMYEIRVMDDNDYDYENTDYDR